MKYTPVIFILMIILISSCFAQGQEDIILLQEYIDKTYTEMLEVLDAPVDKTAYTIENAPTKSWNHQELFSRYPKIPENANIQIMEVIWDADGFWIFACFHMVDEENHCLVAKKIKKGIQF